MPEFSSSRASTQSRSLAKIGRRCPPILPGAALPLALKRKDHFTTQETLMPNNAATDLTVSPLSTRLTTRSRKSGLTASLLVFFP
jgi:hypothetical protein